MKAPLLRTISRATPSFIAVILLLAFLAPPLHAAPVNPWDGDGGYTADYSGIPRLHWTGPGRPGTYAEYLAEHPYRPFRATLVQALPSGRGSSRTEKALVLVNYWLYPAITTDLSVYVADLQAEGFSVETYTIAGGTPATLKSFIESHSTDLAGCVFVGDLPVAWYELEVWGHEEFPCDLYYMDLDGTWTDGDGDGMWDGHGAGSGDEGPEIYIGHIDCSMMSGDEAAITKSYLAKLHAFKTGEIAVPDYALTYTEDDWAGFADIRTDIKYAYPSFQEIYAPDTNKDDYLDDRVPNPAYTFIQIACHSSPFAHYFTRGGKCSNWEIQAAPPYAVFYNLFACSSLRYTEKDFLGGSYIYDTSDTSLAVIGSTKTGSMLVFHRFYIPFGSGHTFGEAFRRWFNHLAPYNDYERAWHFGMTVAGDPFLHKQAEGLRANGYSASAAAGAQVTYFLDISAFYAGRTYLLLGGVSGTAPGFDLKDGTHVPINWDGFTNLVLANLGPPFFQGFMGTLDINGDAQAVFDTQGPLDPSFVGLTFDFAFITEYPPGQYIASNAVELVIEP